MTAASYLEMLEENLLSIYEPGHIFMQDYAHIHTANLVKEWFGYHGINLPNCDSSQNETPHHLIFDCRGQLAIRKRTIQRLDIQDQNLRSIFLTKRGQDQLIKYLEESKIATRKWLLGLV